MQFIFLFLAHTIAATPELPWSCSEDGCWPQTWVLGGQKCGSTAIYKWIHKRFSICAATPQTRRRLATPKWRSRQTNDLKETHFWGDAHEAWNATPRTARRGAAKRLAAQFARLYPSDRRSECLQGFVEATPANLRHLTAPAELAAAVPAPFKAELRFIAVLREPISRDLSAFNAQLGRRVQWCAACPVAPGSTYEAFVACRLANAATVTDGAAATYRGRFGGRRGAGCHGDLHTGFYAAQIELWSSHFPRAHILVLEFSWLVVHFNDVHGGLAAFLRFPPARGDQRLPHTNSKERAGERREVTAQANISCAVRDELQAIYGPHNDRLYALLAKRDGPPEEPEFPPFAPMPCVS